MQRAGSATTPRDEASLLDDWNSLARGEARSALERDALPRYLARQRWYAAKGEPLDRAALADRALWERWLLALVAAGEARYFLPLALLHEPHRRPELALTEVAACAGRAWLAEAIAEDAFCGDLLHAICAGRTVPGRHGAFRFRSGRLCGELVSGLETVRVQRLHTQGTNTGIVLAGRDGAEAAFLKLYRRVRSGVNPELEVGRFLTEVARFRHAVPLAGWMEYASDGESATLALLQFHAPNQGDGWAWTLDYLRRLMAREASDADRRGVDGMSGFLASVRTLGRRTAELHQAFSIRSGDPAFEPEPLTRADIEQWKAAVKEEARSTCSVVAGCGTGVDPREIQARIDACRPPREQALKTRHHGDYHLGQVLVSNGDFILIDFEGEPDRPLADARRKHTPLRDVAGMLRSFSYARWTAGRQGAGTSVHAPGLCVLLERWEQEARAAFLSGYAQAAAGSGLYACLEDARGLLELAEIEKVLYELRYEAANRPDWMHIPMQGLTALLAGR